FWIGDTWEQISRRTPGSELTSKCLWLGASAYAFAKDVEQIRPEEHDRAEERRRELSEKSWQLRVAGTVDAKQR
ncbi:MAG: hypothetical protein AAF802_25720, partial [Planctomycetota bacterium]